MIGIGNGLEKSFPLEKSFQKEGQEAEGRSFHWDSERPREVREQPQNSRFSSAFEPIRSLDSERPREGEPVGKSEVTWNESAQIIPRNGGRWEKEPGNSAWIPDRNLEPGDRNGTNPWHRTWDEIMKKYGFESISFKEGEPDFSEVAKGKVKIDDFTGDRSSNFDQADEKLAEQRSCTPEEIAKWRKENKYTWHECRDCKTMLMVPSEVHGNISHSGGISQYKSQNNS